MHSNRTRYLVLLFVLSLLAWAQSATAADLHPFDLPDGFVQEVLARDLGPVTSFAFRPDGSILIARKHGSVKVWRDGKILEAPFLDISGEVNNYGDRGLMGIAVHPDYPAAPYVYLAYAYEPGDGKDHAESGARTARVVRVEVSPRNPDKARDGSMVVLVGANGAPEHAGDLDRGDRPPYSCFDAGGAPVEDCLPVDGPSHTVDGLVFGPDGALYISAGDGTLQPDLNVRAQNVGSLAGKILRVNPLTGAGYPDNPFYDGNAQSNRSKVFALGMRNPYRFTFDPAGRLVVGDVGGERWEEINRGGPGSNFGWPCLEGPLPNSGDPACAGVLNGSVAAAAAWYSYSHAGGYSAAIGGDFYTGDRFPAQYQGAYFFADHNRAAILYLPDGASGEEQAQLFAGNVIAPVQITEGADGALYVLSFVDGTLSRIRYGGESAASRAEPTAPPPGEPGEAAVKGSTPEVRILSPADESVWPVGAQIQLEGKANDAEDGQLADDRLVWTGTVLHNDHIHPDFFHGTGAAEQLTFEGHGPNTRLELCLTATDSDGLSGSDCVVLRQGEGSQESSGVVEQAAGEPADAAAITVTAEAQEDADSPAPLVPAEEPAETQSGGVLREVWSSVGGSAIADLTQDPSFPAEPDAREVLPTLETAGLGKDYGERLRGWLLPPSDGEYRFWIAADDSGELWLSSDDNPANAVLIAQAEAWTGKRQWDKYPAQASAPILLEGSSRYYIEVRHKQADQKDNVAVAWQRPGGERELVDGAFLVPAD